MKKIYKEVEACIYCQFCNYRYNEYCEKGAFDISTNKGFDSEYKYGENFHVRNGIHRDCPFEDMEE